MSNTRVVLTGEAPRQRRAGAARARPPPRYRTHDDADFTWSCGRRWQDHWPRDTSWTAGRSIIAATRALLPAAPLRLRGAYPTAAKETPDDPQLGSGKYRLYSRKKNPRPASGAISNLRSKKAASSTSARAVFQAALIWLNLNCFASIRESVVVDGS